MTLLELQHDDGRWEGEMVWNTMLLSQHLIVHRLLGADADIAAARTCYARTVLPDGSWPFHPGAAEGSLYVTVLAYVALRLTGTPAPELARTRAWLRAADVSTTPTWGKVWLAVLGLYPWRDVNPLPPELALTPLVRRLYCHTRHVYAGLAYLYGARATFDIAPHLREELYGSTFSSQRHVVHESDLFDRPPWLLRRAFDVVRWYERRPWQRLRAKSLRRCLDIAAGELAASRGHGLSPVSALLGVLALSHANRAEGVAPHTRLLPGTPNFNSSAALQVLKVWHWTDEEGHGSGGVGGGLRVTGARSASWDTAFAIRALVAGELGGAERQAVARAHRWLLGAQAVREIDADMRDPVVGGWSFSDGAHRWPVSDCTAEALSALLEADRAVGTATPVHRVRAAVGFILARQNRDGGFGTYERARAPRWVERLNPSEMYTGCMTDASHVECTASCVSALVRAGNILLADISVWPAVERGVAYLRSRQRPDGSFAGAWGINFTYAAFFVVEALTLAGADQDDPALTKLAEWLIAHQRADGGWGEHSDSCRTGVYVAHERGQATMTAWALLALAKVVGAEHSAVRRGAEFLARCDRARDDIAGVFFGSAGLDYRLYREVFPEWALNATKVVPQMWSKDATTVATPRR